MCNKLKRYQLFSLLRDYCLLYLSYVATDFYNHRKVTSDEGKHVNVKHSLSRSDLNEVNGTRQNLPTGCTLANRVRVCPNLIKCTYCHHLKLRLAKQFFRFHTFVHYCYKLSQRVLCSNKFPDFSNGNKIPSFLRLHNIYTWS